MNTVTITPTGKKISGQISLPASKSITNRLRIIRAYEGGNPAIGNASESDDSLMLSRILSALDNAETSQKVTIIDAGNAGTVFRFLAPFLASRKGIYLLTGDDRMKVRPIGPLTDALRQLGASIEYSGNPGFPPLLIKGVKLTGSEVSVEAGISSQYISALMMLGPTLPEGLKINMLGKPVSGPYLRMTHRLMEQCGAGVYEHANGYVILPGGYHSVEMVVESDWSAAAFWYEIVALAREADIFLDGLAGNSLQGDSVLPDLFSSLGVTTTFTGTGIRLTGKKEVASSFRYDFTSCPDLAQPVMLTCALLGISSEFTGLRSLKIKETDRLVAMIQEMTKLGISSALSEIGGDFNLKIFPSYPNIPTPISFESYGDHRMAMAFAPVSLVTGHAIIRNPDVVSKSYPGFWTDLLKAGFNISRSG